MEFLDTVQNEDKKTLCPFCEKTIETLVEQVIYAVPDKRVFCCPHCRKIVGMG